MCESLPFHPLRSKDFTWTKAPNDEDWTGVNHQINRTYMLRAEQMDTNQWWVGVYVNGSEVFCEVCARSESGVRRRALVELNRYRKRNW